MARGDKVMNGIAQGLVALGKIATNLGASDIPDALARIRALKAGIEALDTHVSERAMALAGPQKRIQGHRFALSVIEATWTGIDADKLRKEMPDVAEKFTKSSCYYQVRLKAAA